MVNSFSFSLSFSFSQPKPPRVENEKDYETENDGYIRFARFSRQHLPHHPRLPAQGCAPPRTLRVQQNAQQQSHQQ